MLITVKPELYKDIKKYPYNFYINEKKDLYIYNKSFFINFLITNNIKYINNCNNNYYYLINNNEIFKYFKSKNILLKIKDMLK